MKQVDGAVIEALVRYQGINFNDLDWINCNLHNTSYRTDFKTRAEYDKAIESDDEFLLIFLIVYSFERAGFDSRVGRCQCNLYNRGTQIDRIRTHPVSVVSGLKAIIGGGCQAGNIKLALQRETTEDLANRWFKKAKEVHKGRFNERGFNSENLRSFLEFFKTGKIGELRDLVRGNGFGEAYELLIKNVKGVGPKVAKFIIRDLAFSLTVWAKGEKLNGSIPKDKLIYAIPIDRWVKRVALSIPTIGNKVKDDLQISDLVEADVADRIDKRLSLTIADVCYDLGLNPLRFDFGAYLFGGREIKAMQGKMTPGEIYSELQKRLIKL